MPDFPHGTVTFLFTDIEGSTRLWEAYPDAMRVALARHDGLMQSSIEANNGVVFKTIGDAFCAAFANASDALAAALQAQRALREIRLFSTALSTASEAQPEGRQIGAEIRVRMAVHTGSVELRNNDYFGQPLNRVARLLSTAFGGQVLLSEVTQELIHDNLPHEAIQLFVERCQAVMPNFTATDANATALTSICHRLDGIPLALELAAARVRVLSVEQIAGRLDDRFRLLTGGNRSALPRQQTLRALIDWSYELLSDLEKQLLARLAIFADGWTLEAVEAVVTGEGIEEWETLDLLSSLVDKSLVMTQVQETSTRYYLLETIRQYAQALPAFQESAEWLHQRHRDYFVALAEEADPHLDGAQQSDWFQRLEQERENMRATLKYCGLASDPISIAAAMRLVAVIYWFWLVRGYVSEGRTALEQALSLSDRSAARNVLTPTDPKTLARVLTGAGTLARAQGDYPGARNLFERNLTLARTIDDNFMIVRSLNNLGAIALDQQDYEMAEALLSESLPLARELQDKNLIAVALNNLGNILFYERRDYPQARALYAESLQIAREQGDNRRIAVSTTNLAVAAQHLNEYPTALALYTESIALFQELEDKQNTAYVIEMLAHVAALRQKPALSVYLFATAEALRTSVSTHLPPADQQEHDARLTELKTRLGATASAYSP